jgi:hypothetical protein
MNNNLESLSTILSEAISKKVRYGATISWEDDSSVKLSPNICNLDRQILSGNSTSSYDNNTVKCQQNFSLETHDNSLRDKIIIFPNGAFDNIVYLPLPRWIVE